MSKVLKLRALKQRLTATVEEIFGLFERTIAEYEEEVSRSKEQNDRQRKLLDTVLNTEERLPRADVQQLLVSGEEFSPEQQDWIPTLVQEDPEPSHVKEEQEQLWTSQEGELLQEPEEADITEYPFTPVPLKNEDDEEKPQSSLLHQSQTEETREAEPLASSSTEWMKTKSYGEDCGILDPASHLQPFIDGKTPDASEPETEDSNDDWKETREPQSGLDSLKNDVLISHKRSYICPYCGKRFGCKGHLQQHIRVHTGEKPFGCSNCGKAFGSKGHLKIHMRVHTGEKPFSCSECDKHFRHKGDLTRHMRIHTGEKPFSCLVCGKIFTRSEGLRSHMVIHSR